MIETDYQSNFSCARGYHFVKSEVKVSLAMYCRETVSEIIEFILYSRSYRDLRCALELDNEFLVRSN